MIDSILSILIAFIILVVCFTILITIAVLFVHNAIEFGKNSDFEKEEIDD